MMNWIDAAIILVLMIFAAHGWRKGFLLLFLEFVGSVASVAVPLLFYRQLAPVLENSIGWTYAFSKAGAFVILWIGTWLVYAFTMRALYKRIPSFIHRSFVNRAAGALPSMAKGLILVALIVTLIVVFPSAGVQKKAVLDSTFGSRMVKVVSAGERVAAGIFSEAIQETLTFLTVEPEPTSCKLVQLKFKTTDVRVNTDAERSMLVMLNRERVKHGLKPLKMDPELTKVARAHSIDMFKRGYFSHVNPDGANPFQRMNKAGIKYVTAGENLAFAPTVELAHRGLMKSPGHRANILCRDFNKIGIGAVENHIYGLMFSQEFTD